MASTAQPQEQKQEPKQKSEWLVILPDQEGAYERRMEVRPQHLTAMTPRATSGLYTLGGAFMSGTSPPKEGERPPIIGSVMLAWAESREEVLEDLRRDVYVEAGVWDWGKVQIYPFKSAFRSALPEK